MLAQEGDWGLFNWYWLPHLPMVVLFFVSALAETNRPPFDLPEADAELKRLGVPRVPAVTVGDRAVRFLGAGGTLVLTVEASQFEPMVDAVLARDSDHKSAIMYRKLAEAQRARAAHDRATQHRNGDRAWIEPQRGRAGRGTPTAPASPGAPDPSDGRRGNRHGPCGLDAGPAGGFAVTPLRWSCFPPGSSRTRNSGSLRNRSRQKPWRCLMPHSVYNPLRHMSHSPTAQFGHGTGSGRRTMPTTRSPGASAFATTAVDIDTPATPSPSQVSAVDDHAPIWSPTR